MVSTIDLAGPDSRPSKAGNGAGRARIAGHERRNGRVFCRIGTPMMHLKNFLRLAPAAVVAVCGATCAPVDPLPESESKPAAQVKTAAIPIPVLPAPVSPGGTRERLKLAIDQVRSRDLLTT